MLWKAVLQIREKGVACVRAAGIYIVSGTLDIWLSYQVPIGPKTSYS